MLFNVEVLDKFKFKAKNFLVPPPPPLTAPYDILFLLFAFSNARICVNGFCFTICANSVNEVGGVGILHSTEQARGSGFRFTGSKKDEEKKSPGSDLNISLNIFIILIYLLINIDLFFITLFCVYIHKYSLIDFKEFF